MILLISFLFQRFSTMRKYAIKLNVISTLYYNIYGNFLPLVLFQPNYWKPAKYIEETWFWSQRVNFGS